MDELKMWLTKEVMGNELWRVLVLLGGCWAGYSRASWRGIIWRRRARIRTAAGGR
jgi:hypothetical protein